MCRADSRASRRQPLGIDPRTRVEIEEHAQQPVQHLKSPFCRDRPSGSAAPKNTNKIHSNDRQLQASAVAARRPSGSGSRNRSSIPGLPWRRPAGTTAASAFQSPQRLRQPLGSIIEVPSTPRRRETSSPAFHPPREPSGSIMLPENILKSACSHFIMSASRSCALAVRIQAATAVGIEQQEENPLGHFGQPSGSTQEPLSGPKREYQPFQHLNLPAGSRSDRCRSRHTDRTAEIRSI